MRTGSLAVHRIPYRNAGLIHLNIAAHKNGVPLKIIQGVRSFATWEQSSAGMNLESAGTRGSCVCSMMDANIRSLGEPNTIRAHTKTLQISDVRIEGHTAVRSGIPQFITTMGSFYMGFSDVYTIAHTKT